MTERLLRIIINGRSTNLFIDRDGIIRDRIFGGMNELVIEAKLEDLLGKCKIKFYPIDRYKLEYNFLLFIN